MPAGKAFRSSGAVGTFKEATFLYVFVLRRKEHFKSYKILFVFFWEVCNSYF